MGRYLDRLNAALAEKGLGDELTKPSKPSCVSFGSSGTGHISDSSPPLDAEGVPCGACPSCGRGEFWRWPKFHRDHNHTGWVCWFCSPPPRESGPCDFCGLPEP